MEKVAGNYINYKLEEINSIIGRQHALEHPREERDWKNYGKEFSDRIKTAIRGLEPHLYLNPHVNSLPINYFIIVSLYWKHH